MEQVIDIEAIKKLPISKRREIIDAIEETIEEEYGEDIDEDDDGEETEEELRILEDRLQEYLKNPQDVISWEDLKHELLTHKNG